MNFLRSIRFALLGLLAAGGMLRAQMVFQFPSENSNVNIAILDNELNTLSGIDNQPGVFKAVYLPAVNKYYLVSHNAATAITVVGGVSLSFNKTVPMSASPTAVVVTPDGTRALILSDALYVVDGATDTVLPPAVAVGTNPIDVVVSRDSKFAYVLSAQSNTITVVDLDTRTVSDTIAYTGTGRNLAIRPTGEICLTKLNNIWVYDPDTLEKVGQFGVAGLPLKPVFTADGQYMLVPLSTSDGSAPVASAALVDWNETDLTKVVRTLTLHDPADNSVVAFDRILISKVGEAYAFAPKHGTIYRLTWLNFLGNAINVVDNGSAPTTGIDDFALSTEYPEAKNLYYIQNQNIGMYDLGSQTPGVTRFGYSGKLSLVQPPSSSTASFSLQYNSLQKIAIGGALQPLLVRLFDANGIPLFDQPVQFSTEDDRVTINNASTFTNADGYAWTYVHVPADNGRFTIDATAADNIDEAFVIISGTGVNPGGGGGGGGGGEILGGLYKIQGDGLVIPPQAAYPLIPLIVEARDEAGRPRAGEYIHWRVIPVTGQPPANVATLQSITSNVGQASNVALGAYPIPPNLSYVQSMIEASWNGYVTDFWVSTIRSGAPPPLRVPLKPSLGNPVVTGGAGDTVAGAIQFQILAQGGPQSSSPMPNVGIRILNTFEDPSAGPTANCVGNIALSDANGIATCDVKFGPVQGLTTIYVEIAGTTWPLGLKVTAGHPNTINIVSGNGQSGSPGSTLGTKLGGLILDGGGNPMAGQAVTWSVDPPSAGTLVNPPAVTDASGQAAALLKLGNTPGTYKVHLTAGSAEAVFNFTVNQVATTLAKISGDSQTAFTGQAYALPVRVRVTDANGAAIAGNHIVFQVIQGDAFVNPAGVDTDSDGYAQATVTAGSVPQSIVVQATATGIATPVTFTLTSVMEGPVVTAAGFMDYSTHRPGIGPGSLMVLQGMGIATSVNGLVTPPPLSLAYPTELAGLKVEFVNPDGTRYLAPILYVQHEGNTELAVLQVPLELTPGSVSADITVNGGTTTVDGILVVPYAPGFLLNYTGNTAYALALHANGSLITTASPAHPGENIRIYMIGLGQTTPPVFTNTPAGADQFVNATVIAGIAHAGVQVVSVKAAQNFVGVYILELTVPASPPTGSAVALDVSVVGPDKTQIFAPGTTIPIGN